VVRPLSNLNLALNRAPNAEEAGFDPNSITNLELWLDASDGDTLTIDGNGRVNVWADKSDNAHTATVTSTSSTLPKVVDVGGINMIQFNGTGNHYEVPNHATLVMGTGRFTLFAVYRKRGTNRGNLFNMGDDKPRYELFINSDTGPGGRAAVSFADSVDIVFASNNDKDYSDDTKRGLACTRDADGDFPHYELLTAGKSALPLSPLEGTVVGDINPVTALFIGARKTGVNPMFLDGDLGEILIYKSGLSDAELDAVNDYLSVKWGL
jgi:hypothetical protein